MTICADWSHIYASHLLLSQAADRPRGVLLSFASFSSAKDEETQFLLIG
jgi:hypothetical protein